MITRHMVEIIAVIGMPGIFVVGVVPGLIGGIMPVLMLIGMIDGPTGGRRFSD
jgi:hypothetical protein